jgi:hypothetical protein
VEDAAEDAVEEAAEERHHRRELLWQQRTHEREQAEARRQAAREEAAREEAARRDAFINGASSPVQPDENSTPTPGAGRLQAARGVSPAPAESTTDYEINVACQLFVNKRKAGSKVVGNVLRSVINGDALEDEFMRLVKVWTNGLHTSVQAIDKTI